MQLVERALRRSSAAGGAPVSWGRAAAFVMPRLGRRFPRLIRALARLGPLPPQVRLANLITGYWTSQAIAVTAALGIADVLQSRARTATDLAARLEVPSEPLQRLLRALASVGILREI